jgi:TolB protein
MLIIANMKKSILIAVSLLSLLYTSNLLAQKTNVSGTISGGRTTSLITIGLDKFTLDSSITSAGDIATADSLHKVLRDDLEFTLYFNVVQPDSAFLVDIVGKPMSLDDWIYIGAQMLIKGRLSKHEGMYTLGLEVIETSRNTLTYSHEFLGEIGRYRYLAHKTADDLLQNLTGEKGVFFSKIVYSRDDGKGAKIYVCDFDGFNPIQIALDPSAKPINVLPSWSAAGDKVYFTSYRKGNPDLYCYDFAANSLIPISTRQGLNYSAAQAPDGKSIAVALSYANNFEIYILDNSGKVQHQVTYSGSIDTSPTWSPNSKQLAFVSDRTGSPQIYVTDIDGFNTRRLTYVGDYNCDPSWSPKGDRLAFTSRESGLFQIYTIDITGQKAYKLTDLGSNEAPCWSPDGLHIVYSSDADGAYAGAYAMWVMNFDGSGKKKMPLDGVIKSPNWSINLR